MREKIYFRRSYDMEKIELREHVKALLSNRILVAGLCFVVVAGIFVFMFVSARINEQKEDALIRNMKDLSYFEYFYYAGSTKISEITRKEGRGYKIGSGLGSAGFGFGQAELPLWQGTSEIDESLQLYPMYLLRIADDKQAFANSQYADGTFKVSIYTSYYFSPTASGNLSYKFTVDWNQYSTIQKQATLYLIDKTTNTEKQLRTFSMTERPDGMYGTSATTGGWTLGGLNPDHDYYFRITKTTDGIEADLSGVISSEWW